ncbi:hypothetical protein VL21_16825 [Stenotrophomonas maltophilia]|nr:hypothetical protein VL21_16825 [Stenotrophomonas maltophilia]
MRITDTSDTWTSQGSRALTATNSAHERAGTRWWTMENPSPKRVTVKGSTVTAPPQALVSKPSPSVNRVGARPSRTIASALTPAKVPSNPKEFSTLVDNSRRLSLSSDTLDLADTCW